MPQNPQLYLWIVLSALLLWILALPWEQCFCFPQPPWTTGYSGVVCVLLAPHRPVLDNSSSLFGKAHAFSSPAISKVHSLSWLQRSSDPTITRPILDGLGPALMSCSSLPPSWSVVLTAPEMVLRHHRYNNCTSSTLNFTPLCLTTLPISCPLTLEVRNNSNSFSFILLQCSWSTMLCYCCCMPKRFRFFLTSLSDVV